MAIKNILIRGGTMEKFRLALGQMDTREKLEDNLCQAEQMVREASKLGAEIIAFPEVYNVIDGSKTPPEKIPDGESTRILIQLAREYKMYILNGSIGEENPNGGKKFNTSVLIDPAGNIVAKYRKLHLFDVDLPDGTKKRESENIEHGNKIVHVETPLAHFGLSICYDIRFPELYRLLTLAGSELIFVPANFTMATGKDHWEPLLRSRAIENTVYIAAPAQIGTKYGNHPSFGNSMIIDPWGTVIARAAEKASVIFADIDLSYLKRVRALIPSVQNRRNDLYSLIETSDKK